VNDFYGLAAFHIFHAVHATNATAIHLAGVRIHRRIHEVRRRRRITAFICTSIISAGGSNCCIKLGK
jgi:hypothetical protein